MKSCARQWGKDGWRLNWIGVGSTAFLPKLIGAKAPVLPDMSGPAIGHQPSIAEEVGPLIALLSEGAARPLTGASLFVDGGEWMLPSSLRAAVPVVLDAGDAASCRAAITEVTDHFGRLDILVHNATHGYSAQVAPIDDVEADWSDPQMAVSLAGSHYLAREAFPWLKASGDGRLILFSSIRGVAGLDAGLCRGEGGGVGYDALARA